MNHFSQPERVLYAIVAVALVLGAMKAAAGFLVPALLALFIAIVSAQPMYWLIEKGSPRWLAITLVVLILLVISSTFPLVLSGSFMEFTQQLPFYQEKAESLLNQSTVWINQLGYGDSLASIFDPGEALGYVQRFLSALGGILSRYFLILLLVIFILVDVPRSLNESTSAAGQITRTVQHYFAIKTFTSFLTGVAIALWLALLEVQYPMLWGFLAFLLNFVPNIGSVIASIPALFLTVIFQGYLMGFIVMIGYAVINVGISNGLEPRILGRQLGLRFVWIFLSLILWGWILGPIGMLLAVPLTMTLRIIMENHPSSRWIATIMMPDPEKVNKS
ncbi:MAG: hypothetical protein CMQ40_00160 [Gammaproteobacteria bacterium]|nr:hypothetical protein [Gammaproteobacteria bacterium]